MSPLSSAVRIWILNAVVALSGVFIGIPAAHSAEVQFSSGERATALIELFSSEGCSSCPPAERWLGELRHDPGLWREFVPVAFHVDYWNRLGWTDRFSRREFTERQYAVVRTWGNGSVYTPCFVRDGVEWRPSQRPPSANPSAVGLLNVTIVDGKTCRIEFSPVARSVAFDVHVALLGGGFVSKVTRGENRGETLPQEFVALALTDHALAADGSIHRAEFDLPRSEITDAARRALAVWITRRGELTPLQATGGWLK